jgi:alpha-amylase/alpha-mannosidase (GH57 family)
MPALIIHGHFYQPPRENPWTGIIEPQPSAAPFHDWNERIHAECYGPNAFVELSNRTINNCANISFNFGPTLLSWLEQNHAETYQRIIQADLTSSLKYDGHGNAIAQAYGHAILPLCNERDLRTQIRWGLADFRYRFGREAEAMWLPETACNDDVMDALIDEGLRFVILAPNQARRVRAEVISGGDSLGAEVSTGSRSLLSAWERLGEGAKHSDRVRGQVKDWHEVNDQTIDTSISYKRFHRDDSRRSIAVFFYDGPTSRAIAFEKLLTSSSQFVNRLALAASGREMVNVATDGETYGHHFKFGDLCLAHALEEEAPARDFQSTNYAAYLGEHPPEIEVEINSGPNGEGTSWSCAHGVGRWIRNCGCETGGEPGWNQQWRTPLRQALDYLRDENVNHFEATRGELFTSPWLARDESIALILGRDESREEFLFDHAGRWLSSDEQHRALSYLELQRMLVLMYTSCGWFFNDISGIETIQILGYAGRAIDLMDQLGLPSVRDRFLEILSEAKSNKAEMGSGADIYRKFVEQLRHSPSVVNELSVAK